MLYTTTSNESMLSKQEAQKPHIKEKLSCEEVANSGKPVVKTEKLSSEKSADLVDEAKPFFIFDWLEEIDPQDLELAQKILKTPPKKKIPSSKVNGSSDNNSSNNKQVSKDLFGTPSKFLQRSISIGNGYNAKGIQKARQGAWADALACWENALEIRTQVLGENHIDVANTCNNIGIALGKLDRISDAVELLNRALEIRKEHYGVEHIEVAATLHNLGNVYQQVGDLETAIQCYCECKTLQEKFLGGSDHVEIARSCIAIGHTYYQAQSFEDARAAYMDALFIFNRVGLPDDNPEVLSTINYVKQTDDEMKTFNAINAY